MGLQSRILLRAIFIVVASAGIIWSLLTLPVERNAIPLRHIASDIASGEKYSPEGLARIGAYADLLDPSGGCYSSAPKEVAMLRLRAAATMLAVAHQPEIAQALQRADTAIRKALVCSPYQPFLWYALYWVESTASGDKGSALPSLEMSYRLGPYEGWVSWLRSRAALPLLDRFPTDIRDRVLTEFVDMAKDDTREAAKNFLRANEQLRAILLPLLTQVPVKQRTDFAQILQDADVDIKIPGVQDRDRLPWH